MSDQGFSKDQAAPLLNVQISDVCHKLPKETSMITPHSFLNRDPTSSPPEKQIPSSRPESKFQASDRIGWIIGMAAGHCSHSLLLALIAFALSSVRILGADDSVAAGGYDHRVDRWLEVAAPSEDQKLESIAFSRAAWRSDLSWWVSLEDGQVVARDSPPEVHDGGKDAPDFEVPVAKYRGVAAFDRPSDIVRVDDGWLVAYHWGEFGGGLYWFSADGARRYKVSDHQIREFLLVGEKVLAVDGLAHRMTSRGSLLLIRRSDRNEDWRADELAVFPGAPRAWAFGDPGVLYVAMSEGLASVNGLTETELLTSSGEWIQWQPTSLVPSPDGKSISIGMKQYVGIYDLHTGAFRYLIPDRSMLRELSEEERDQIRRSFGGGEDGGESRHE